MAKNAVTDWSTTDSLNTDIGSTNIAEGCAPGGINDAIRKVMAQVAAFITAPTFSGALSGTSANLSGTVTASGAVVATAAQGNVEVQRLSATGRILSFDRVGNSYQPLAIDGSALSLNIGGATAVTVGASGVIADLPNGFAVFSGDPANYNISRSATTTFVKGAGGVALSVAGTTLVNTTGVVTTIYNKLLVNDATSINSGFRVQAASTFGGAGAGVEIQYSGGSGLIAAYDRAGGGTDKTMSVQGSNVQLVPVGGAVYSAGNHVVQGALAVGGSTLGGVNGQIQFNRSDGTANVLSIALTTGPNSFTFNNSDNSGRYSFRFNGSEKLSITNAAVSSPSPFVSSSSMKAGLSTVGTGSVQIAPGDATKSGTLEFLDTVGSSIGSIQQSVGGPVNYLNSGGGGHSFQGGNLTVRGAGAGGLVAKTGSATLTGQMVMTDTAGGTSATIGGQAIGQPTAHSNSAGHAFNGGPSFFGSYLQAAGQVDGTTPGLGTSGGLRTRGSNGGGPAIVQFTNTNSTDEWASIIADPAGNRLTVVVGHIPVFSIDGGGNVRALGSILSNVTP